jgi:DNA-binding response OmpR family regulator
MKRFRRSQRLRILVVQARPDSREMLRRLLCAATYEVHTAESCAQGRLVASSLEQGPDVVVADVRLPDGDGVDLMSELHALHGCRTIALAARLTHDRDARRCREAGIDRTVPEPLGPEALRATMAVLAAGGERN